MSKSITDNDARNRNTTVASPQYSTNYISVIPSTEMPKKKGSKKVNPSRLPVGTQLGGPRQPTTPKSDNTDSGRSKKPATRTTARLKTDTPPPSSPGLKAEDVTEDEPSEISGSEPPSAFDTEASGPSSPDFRGEDGSGEDIPEDWEQQVSPKVARKDSSKGRQILEVYMYKGEVLRAYGNVDDKGESSKQTPLKKRFLLETPSPSSPIIEAQGVSTEAVPEPRETELLPEPTLPKSDSSEGRPVFGEDPFSGLGDEDSGNKTELTKEKETSPVSPKTAKKTPATTFFPSSGKGMPIPGETLTSSGPSGIYNAPAEDLPALKSTRESPTKKVPPAILVSEPSSPEQLHRSTSKSITKGLLGESERKEANDASEKPTGPLFAAQNSLVSFAGSIGALLGQGEGQSTDAGTPEPTPANPDATFDDLSRGTQDLIGGAPAVLEQSISSGNLVALPGQPHGTGSIQPLLEDTPFADPEAESKSFVVGPRDDHHQNTGQSQTSSLDSATRQPKDWVTQPPPSPRSEIDEMPFNADWMPQTSGSSHPTVSPETLLRDLPEPQVSGAYGRGFPETHGTLPETTSHTPSETTSHTSSDALFAPPPKAEEKKRPTVPIRDKFGGILPKWRDEPSRPVGAPDLPLPTPPERFPPAPVSGDAPHRKLSFSPSPPPSSNSVEETASQKVKREKEEAKAAHREARVSWDNFAAANPNLPCVKIGQEAFAWYDKMFNSNVADWLRKEARLLELERENQRLREETLNRHWEGSVNERASPEHEGYVEMFFILSKTYCRFVGRQMLIF